MKKLSTLFALVSFCVVLGLSALICVQNLSNHSAENSYNPAPPGGTQFAAVELNVRQVGVALSD